MNTNDVVPNEGKESKECECINLLRKFQNDELKIQIPKGQNSVVFRYFCPHKGSMYVEYIILASKEEKTKIFKKIIL